MKAIAYCLECNKRHTIDFNPRVPTDAFSDWSLKHASCNQALVGHKIVGYDWPERTTKPSWVTQLKHYWKRFCAPWQESRYVGSPWLASLLANANVTAEYGSSADFTITLASLATSSTLVAGRESTSVSNTTNKRQDYGIGGRVTTGTTPTVSRSIEIWGYASLNDTPLYPDVMDGTDSAETVTSADMKAHALAHLITLGPTSASSNISYDFGLRSLAALFGFIVPKNFGVWVVHDTAVNLNSTGSNHIISYSPYYYAIA